MLKKSEFSERRGREKKLVPSVLCPKAWDRSHVQRLKPVTKLTAQCYQQQKGEEEKSWEAFRARQVGRSRQPAGHSRWAARSREAGHTASLPSAVSWHCPPAPHSYPSTISERCSAQKNNQLSCKAKLPTWYPVPHKWGENVGKHTQAPNVGVERHLCIPLKAIWQQFCSTRGENSSYFIWSFLYRWYFCIKLMNT